MTKQFINLCQQMRLKSIIMNKSAVYKNDKLFFNSLILKKFEL